MFNKKYITLAAVLFAVPAFSADVQITGTVQSKCSIFTDIQGVYGSPLPNTLSTAPEDGGVDPVFRIDVAKAGYYIAKVTTPTEFTSSPALTDSVTWTGSVSISEVSDAGMSAYETSKVEYETTTEYDLAIAGTTWFKASSKAEYGVDKSLPAGSYRSAVTVECVAK
jgi:hypothetical protein